MCQVCVYVVRSGDWDKEPQTSSFPKSELNIRIRARLEPMPWLRQFRWAGLTCFAVGHPKSSMGRGARWFVWFNFFTLTSHWHWLHKDFLNFSPFSQKVLRLGSGIQAIEAIFATISLAVSSGLSLVQATKGLVKSFPCYWNRFVLEFLGLIGWGKFQCHSAMLRCCLVKRHSEKNMGDRGGILASMTGAGAIFSLKIGGYFAGIVLRSSPMFAPVLTSAFTQKNLFFSGLIVGLGVVLRCQSTGQCNMSWMAILFQWLQPPLFQPLQGPGAARSPPCPTHQWQYLRSLWCRPGHFQQVPLHPFPCSPWWVQVAKLP